MCPVFDFDPNPSEDGVLLGTSGFRIQWSDIFARFCGGRSSSLMVRPSSRREEKKRQTPFPEGESQIIFITFVPQKKYILWTKD